MLYPSIDELKKRADSRYTLVMIASKRSRDLIDGYPSLVDIGNEKPVSIATEEIARDMISYTRKLRTEEDESDEGMESADRIVPEASAGEESTETESGASEQPDMDADTQGSALSAGEGQETDTEQGDIEDPEEDSSQGTDEIADHEKQ